MPIAESTPIDTAEEGQRHCFEQKLHYYRALGRADGFTDADLLGPLGHGYEHNIHYADTAHKQPEARDGDRGQTYAADDPVELLDELVRGLYVKIIRLAKRNFAPLPQNTLDILRGFKEPPVLGLDDLEKKITLRGHLSRCAVGHKDLAVLFVFAEKAGLTFFDHADHFPGLAVHPDDLTDARPRRPSGKSASAAFTPSTITLRRLLIITTR